MHSVSALSRQIWHMSVSLLSHRYVHYAPDSSIMSLLEYCMFKAQLESIGVLIE